MTHKFTNLLFRVLGIFTIFTGIFNAPIPVPTASAAVSSDEAPVDNSVMFIENVGQFDDAARFQVRGGKSTIWLSDDSIWITMLEEPAVTKEEELLSMDDPLGKDTQMEIAPMKGVNIKLSFDGANPNPTLEPFNRLETSVNYFIGNDPDQWQSNVPVWGGVRYKDLYPGIDLEISGQAGQVTQRFMAQVGANLGMVKLNVDGAEEITLDGERLLIKTTFGVYMLPLFEVSGYDMNAIPNAIVSDQQIKTPFRITGLTPIPEVLLSGASDLIYSTFLGGSHHDYGYSIAVDSNGAAFITGETLSVDFPIIPGAFDTSHNGSRDIFVVKLNATGSALDYSTFIGGNDQEGGSSIAISSNGAAFITGYTMSVNFPTTLGAYDVSHNGNKDVFVVKLNATGSGVDYSTFLGGSHYEGGRSIAIDANGAAFITGDTDSNDFPITHVTFDPFYSGAGDGFVVKLNPAGSELDFSTFLGGDNSEISISIAVDSNGAAFITGSTYSTDFSTTHGAFDEYFNGVGDAFVVKMNFSSLEIEYSTFLGGSGGDVGSSIAVDSSGAAFISGYTKSTDFPTSLGAFDVSHNGNKDVFVVKLNATGSGVDYSTFLGGSGDDVSHSIALDSSSAALISGYTESTDFPTTLSAFDDSQNGGDDVFMVKLNAAGSALDYSTFLGGSNYDDGGFIAVDSNGAAFITGETWSRDFPTTPGAFDVSNDQTAYDAFVVKLFPGEPAPTISIYIEITQAIQDEENLVPLIANKPTFARVYVDCGMDNCSIPNVTGVLRAFGGDGNQIGQDLEPKNISITAEHKKWTEQRDDLRKSLNFSLPTAWLTGDKISITAEVNGVLSSIQRSLLPSKPLRISYIKIRENDGINGVYEPDNSDMANSQLLFRKLYPIDPRQIEYVALQDKLVWKFPMKCLSIKPIDIGNCLCLELNIALSRIYKESYGFLFGWLPSQGFPLSSMDPYLGCTSKVSPNTGYGKASKNEITRNRTITHEIGHLLGVPDFASNDNNRCAITDTPYVGSPSIQQWGLDGNGKDWEVSSNNALRNPSSTYDYMSYCNIEESFPWVSPWVYETTYTNGQKFGLPKYSQKTSLEEQQFFDISALVFSDDSVLTNPIWVTSSSSQDIPPIGISYCIELQNISGDPLVHKCFDLDFIDYETGDPSTVDGFRIMLPYSSEISRIVLTKGEKELFVKYVSQNFPTVSITYPNGGETWYQTSTQTVTWNASDLDGDSLIYDVEYSPDGTTWLPIGTNITENQIEVNAADLPGSTSARIRVTTTDGVNTVSDQSDAVFTVAKKRPKASILSPEESGITIGNGFIMFQGSGYDVEDGTLPEASLSWSSSIEGLIGTGSIIQANLTPGSHTITLTAIDADGNIGTAETVINVASCYYLTVTHSGQGSDPTAIPGYSSICPTGYYLEGESINLAGALPEENWQISGWTGSSNDGSTASSNNLTMPAENHMVRVNYVPDTFPPAVPTLTFPEDDAVVRGTPEYAWAAGSDAVVFLFQYDDNSDFSSPIFTSGEMASTSYTPLLQVPGIYFWHVKARDTAGNWTNWSDFRKITIKPLIPVAPVLVSPVSGKFTNDNTPTLFWESVPYGIKYKIQVSKSATFNSLEQQRILTPGILKFTTLKLPDGKHFWRVRAINSLGELGAWSVVRYFTVDTVAPVAPVLSTPANGATVTGIPKYTWKASVGAKKYQFQYAKDINFSTGKFTSPVITVLYYKPSTQPKGTYYWRVRAQDAAGNWSAWSLSRKITIK